MLKILLNPTLASNHNLMDILFHHLTDSNPWFHILNNPPIYITKHVFVLWLIAILLLSLLLYASKSIKNSPTSRLSTSILLFLEFVENHILKPNFHQKSKPWLPFFSTLFLFIAFSNLFGLIPLSATITGNLAVTLSLAIVTFLITQAYGMKKHGPILYWIKLVPSGIPKPLWPLMFLIEIVGLLSKPFALTIRLFSNMIAGHIVILVLLFLATQTAGQWSQLAIAPFTIAGALFVNLLEIFIALLQAYIFSFLSAIFISSASHSH